MDPIITQWNSEWVTGPGGVVFLMQKQNEAALRGVCPVQGKKKKKKCLSDFWHQAAFGWREVLAAEPDRSIFLQSMSVCQVEEIFTAPLLYFSVLMWNVSVRVFFFFFSFPCSPIEQADAPLFIWHTTSFKGVCVCVAIFSPSVFRHIKLFRGWEKGR